MTISLHQMRSCEKCGHCDDPTCWFVMRQFTEAEKRIRRYAEAHKAKTPNIDVAITCFSSDVAFHGPGA